MHGGRTARVRVGKKSIAGRIPRLGETGERRGLASRVAEVSITVADGPLVPGADTLGIGSVQRNAAILIEFEQRMRVIHHRSAIPVAGGKVMRQPQGMPDLVGRQLPYPCQRHGAEWPGDGVRTGEWRTHALGDAVVLAYAQGSEGDMALDDFTGARVVDAVTI